ncbi:MAG: hypothetical protein ACP5VS_09060 [Desulfomonilaceae bacterium]
MIYTTNAIESLHMSLREIIRNRVYFPHHEFSAQLRYLALKNAPERWTALVHSWLGKSAIPVCYSL